MIFDFAAILYFHADAYTSSEIVYTWRKGLEKSVVIPPESSNLLQYDLIGQTLFNKMSLINTGSNWLIHISETTFELVQIL